MEKENTVPNVAAEKHTLDAIEQSVKSLHVRIQYLLKEDNKHRKKLEDTFQDSIRLIERKVEQTQQHRKLRQVTEQGELQNKSVQSRVKQMRQRQHQQFVAARESMDELKKEERNTIRELSRHNEQIIEESRKKLLEKKKHLVQELRQEKESSRANLLKQTQQRKQELRQMKEAERKANEQKRQKLLHQLKDKERVEKELLLKIRHTSENISHFSNLVRVTSDMKLEDFEAILKEAGQTKSTDIKQGKGIEKIMQLICLSKVSQLRQKNSAVLCTKPQDDEHKDAGASDPAKNVKDIYRKKNSSDKKTPSQYDPLEESCVLKKGSPRSTRGDVKQPTIEKQLSGKPAEQQSQDQSKIGSEQEKPKANTEQPNGVMLDEHQAALAPTSITDNN